MLERTSFSAAVAGHLWPPMVGQARPMAPGSELLIGLLTPAEQPSSGQEIPMLVIKLVKVRECGAVDELPRGGIGLVPAVEVPT